MARSKIEGMDDLEKSFKRLGKVPQSVATKAARAGASIALKAARANAPEDTGQLRKGTILKGERKTVAGKKVYDVMMNPAMNDVFVKHVKNPVQLKGNRAYYPASQEYGFRTVDGEFVPGYHYLRDAVVGNKEAIERVSIDAAAKEIDRQWRRAYMKDMKRK